MISPASVGRPHSEAGFRRFPVESCNSRENHDHAPPSGVKSPPRVDYRPVLSARSTTRVSASTRREIARDASGTGAVAPDRASRSRSSRTRSSSSGRVAPGSPPARGPDRSAPRPRRPRGPRAVPGMRASRARSTRRRGRIPASPAAAPWLKTMRGCVRRRRAAPPVARPRQPRDRPPDDQQSGDQEPARSGRAGPRRAPPRSIRSRDPRPPPVRGPDGPRAAGAGRPPPAGRSPPTASGWGDANVQSVAAATTGKQPPARQSRPDHRSLRSVTLGGRQLPESLGLQELAGEGLVDRGLADHVRDPRGDQCREHERGGSSRTRRSSRT